MTALNWRVATPEELAANDNSPSAVAWREQEARQAECGKRDGGHRWHLEIDCGQASVSCADCHADPGVDYTDLLTMSAVPVRLEWQNPHPVGRCGQLEGCDCDWWIEISVQPEGEPK